MQSTKSGNAGGETPSTITGTESGGQSVGTGNVSTETCVGEGRIAFNDATGKRIECCEGLTEVTPADCTLNENNSCCTGADCKIGCGTICIKCEDGVCSSLENKCNCPSDCAELIA